MMGLGQIIAMNDEIAQEARRKGLEPKLAQADGQIEDIPNLGYYTPEGWDRVETFFVDKTGWGQAGEPALTQAAFMAKVKEGRGYAIVEEGEMQVYVGEFIKEA
jgi:hypothetical protein